MNDSEAARLFWQGLGDETTKSPRVSQTLGEEDKDLESVVGFSQYRENEKMQATKRTPKLPKPLGLTSLKIVGDLTNV